MSEIFNQFTLRPRVRNWTDDTRWTNWEKHEQYLRRQPKWKPRQVDSVCEESLRIISKTTPVSREEYQCRGLVVGYVQSGKTANFTAVAARAADIGYRLIIVLSGIHDSLRNQTQKRLNKELVEIGENWVSLTDEYADFEIPLNPNGFDSCDTVLVVIKKIPPILRRLNSWIIRLEGQMADIPVLVIDDEADQASINTKGNRADPTVDRISENEDEDPSITNALIRDILQRIPKATYIGYTATPFANILINPGALDREVGADLFPKDFVLQLPRPEGYTGTEELFGASSQGRNIMRLVLSSDVGILKSKRRKKNAPLIASEPSDNLPQSLCDAVLTFVVVGAIRLLRGQTGVPNTMLVHVSQMQADQSRIGNSIERQIKSWRDQERIIPGSLRNLLNSSLIELRETLTENDKLNILDEAVVNLSRVQVAVLNSKTGEELEYDIKPNRQLIAVGGNRLSRGLTLEGLTIAYFLRTTSMADSLLQMARWYGFRAGYEDLIRIWTTEGIAQWFVELALVEESLRDSITAMNKAGRRPDEMALKMRAHSDLLLTSKLKSKMREDYARTWSRENPQTILFPLNNAVAIDHNINLTEQLLYSFRSTQEAHGGRLSYDVPALNICNFVRNFVMHEDTLAFQGGLISDWIAERNENGELTTWTIFVVNPYRERAITLADQKFGLVFRSLTGVSSIGVLIDPRHEGVDLHGGPDAYCFNGIYNSRAMRNARPSSHGLLIIYLIDPTPLKVSVKTVIGIALSLPKTSDETSAFIVNRGVKSA